MLFDKKFQSTAAVIFLVPHTTEKKISSNTIHRKISKALFFFFALLLLVVVVVVLMRRGMLWEEGSGRGGVLRTSTGRMNFGIRSLWSHDVGLTALKKYFRFCHLTASNWIILPNLFAWHWLTAWLRRDLFEIEIALGVFYLTLHLPIDYSHSDILYTGLKHFSFFLSLFFCLNWNIYSEYMDLCRCTLRCRSLTLPIHFRLLCEVLKVCFYWFRYLCLNYSGHCGASHFIISWKMYYIKLRNCNWH